MPQSDYSEPKTIKAIVDRLVRELGWEDKLHRSKLEACFGKLFDGKISSFARIKGYKNHTLFIETESSTWRAELRLRKDKIAAEINSAVGSEIVREIVIT